MCKKKNKNSQLGCEKKNKNSQLGCAKKNKNSQLGCEKKNKNSQLGCETHSHTQLGCVSQEQTPQQELSKIHRAFCWCRIARHCNWQGIQGTNKN